MSAQELVDIVDDNDNVIDTVERHIMREKHLPHRASYIAVCDKSGRFVVEVRTLTKDYAPGLFDACVGGVLQHGEDPFNGALRELHEEIGISLDPQSSDFISLGKIKVPYKSGRGFLYAYLYLAKSDAITTRQKEEVSAIMMLSYEELVKLSDACTYDSILVFKDIVAKAKAQGYL